MCIWREERGGTKGLVRLRLEQAPWGRVRNSGSEGWSETRGRGQAVGFLALNHQHGAGSRSHAPWVPMHPNSVLSCLVLPGTHNPRLVQHLLPVQPSSGPASENQAAAYAGNRAQQCQRFQEPVPGQQLHKS